MGASGTIIDPDLEAQARSALAVDFVRPERCRLWARLHLAMTHWHLLDQDTHSQGSIAKAFDLKPTSLWKARQPSEAEPRKDTLGGRLSDIADMIGVDADWLVSGYNRMGLDVWPDWTATDTVTGQASVLAVWRAYLLRHIDDDAATTFSTGGTKRPVPAVLVEIVGAGQSPLLTDKDALGEDRNFPPEAVEIGKYITRSGISVDTYLRRYRWLLAQDWDRYLRLAKTKWEKPVPRPDLRWVSSAPDRMRTYGMPIPDTEEDRVIAWIHRRWQCYWQIISIISAAMNPPRMRHPTTSSSFSSTSRSQLRLR